MNDANDDTLFRCIRAFFKGVVVTIKPTGARKKITSFVRSAGAKTFISNAGGEVTIAVRVSSQLPSSGFGLTISLGILGRPPSTCVAERGCVRHQEWWRRHIPCRSVRDRSWSALHQEAVAERYGHIHSEDQIEAGCTTAGHPKCSLFGGTWLVSSRVYVLA